MPLILTSTALSFFICTLVPSKTYSNFPETFLETWQAIVIFKVVKKCFCQGKIGVDKTFGFCRHRWSIWEVQEHTCFGCFAEDAPHSAVTHCSHRQQESGCARNFERKSCLLLGKSSALSELCPDLSLLRNCLDKRSEEKVFLYYTQFTDFPRNKS